MFLTQLGKSAGGSGWWRGGGGGVIEENIDDTTYILHTWQSFFVVPLMVSDVTANNDRWTTPTVFWGSLLSASQTCYLLLSWYADTEPTGPTSDLILPGRLAGYPSLYLFILLLTGLGFKPQASHTRDGCVNHVTIKAVTDFTAKNLPAPRVTVCLPGLWTFLSHGWWKLHELELCKNSSHDTTGTGINDYFYVEKSAWNLEEKVDEVFPASKYFSIEV